jgi:hypothetical protein
MRNLSAVAVSAAVGCSGGHGKLVAPQPPAPASPAVAPTSDRAPLGAAIPDSVAGEPAADAPESADERPPVANPLAVRPVGELFASLAAFRKAHPIERDPSCDPVRPGAKSAPVKLRGRGAIRAVEVVRVAGDVACAQVERCSMAIQTDKGWFVEEPETTCNGVIGPASRVARRNERLSWVDAGGTFVIEYLFTVVTTRQSHTASAGSDPAVQRDETRWLSVCGQGGSGEPRCTEPVAVSCADFDGNILRATWHYRAGQLVLESTGDPEQCVNDALTLGSFPLEL